MNTNGVLKAGVKPARRRRATRPAAAAEHVEAPAQVGRHDAIRPSIAGWARMTG